MGKVIYNNISFDSELEADYWKHLEEDVNVEAKFYHLKKPIQVTRGNTYTPDFVVVYDDRIEIVETKGYNPYSKMRDDMIHQVMLSKTELDLYNYLIDNGFTIKEHKDIIYRKIKHLKGCGFVDWDFKNPNTIANKRKEKIELLEAEIKELKAFKKDAIRYWCYLFKKQNNAKLTTRQSVFCIDYQIKMFNEVAKNESNS